MRWRGVPMDERIALRPETLDVHEILLETNAERRRVMMERFGLDRFMRLAEAQVLDEDNDAGGRRRLLRIELAGDEALVCVSVICPSTHRQFMLRVPPSMTTCRQAVAWTAGFDDPHDYQPIRETRSGRVGTAARWRSLRAETSSVIEPAFAHTGVAGIHDHQ